MEPVDISFSKGWLDRFLDRNNISQCCQPPRALSEISRKIRILRKSSRSYAEKPKCDIKLELIVRKSTGRLPIVSHSQLLPLYYFSTGRKQKTGEDAWLRETNPACMAEHTGIQDKESTQTNVEHRFGCDAPTDSRTSRQ